MKSILLFCLGLGFSSFLYAEDPFVELEQEMALFEQQSPDSPLLNNEFQRYLSEQEKQYKIWQRQYLKEFDQFQKELVSKWGEGDFSQKERNVEFSEDKNVKSVVDYQNEQVTVALLVDKNLSQDAAEKIMQQKIAQLIAKKDSNISAIFDAPDALKDGKLSVAEVQYSEAKKQQLNQMIVKQTQAQFQEIDKRSDRAQLGESQLSEDESQRRAADEKQQLLKLSQTRLHAADNNYEQAKAAAHNDKKIVLYKLPLPKNALAKRASQYAGLAEKEGRIRAVPSALIMAIMHSESAFEPRAKSAVPAYGLMQIVPRTAGRDVNKMLNNIDKPMPKELLYKPSINVETGAAYLNILDQRYLSAIKDDRSRLYCTIAAYNTGAGNVARAFNANGSRNIKQAAKVINQLSSVQVYQHLLAKLPYAETKDYLQRVNSRIALYQRSQKI